MMSPTQPPAEPLRRVLENAGLLTLASLLVMSLALGRYDGALVWCGALLVFFAQAWEGRTRRRADADRAAVDAAVPEKTRHFDALRWVGVTLACSGAIALSL
jgi:hypothetical protein